MAGMILDAVVRIGLVVPTAIIFFVIFMTYLRIRSRKMLLMSIGFGIFFTHALIAIPEIFSSAYDIFLNENAHLLINLIALIFILFGTLQD